MGVAPGVIVFPIGGAHLEVKRAAVRPLGFEVSLPFAREGVLSACVDGRGGSYQDCGREEGYQSALHHKLTSEGDLQGDTASLFIYGDDATGKMFHTKLAGAKCSIFRRLQLFLAV